MRLKLGPCSTVTQLTSKSTAVICEGVGGQITTHAASLGASTSVGFTVTNSYVAAGDTINLSISSGATVASYVVLADTVAAGSFKIHLRNISGGALLEAVVINFSIIKNNF